MQDIKDIEYALKEYGDWWELADCTEAEVEGIDGLVSGVEMKGGGEGSGEYTHVVIRIQTGSDFRYFKQVGCHVSHDGVYWDGPFTEVRQQQKTITVWE